MYAVADELSKQPAPAEAELLGYRILYLVGRLAALEEIAERRWDKIAPVTALQEAVNLHKEVNEFERIHILEALKVSYWKREKAAKLLGTTRRKLEYRCAQLGITEGGRKDVGSVKSTWRKLVSEVNPVGPTGPTL